MGRDLILCSFCYLFFPVSVSVFVFVSIFFLFLLCFLFFPFPEKISSEMSLLFPVIAKGVMSVSAGVAITYQLGVS